jgi:hypothetical protein
MNKTNPFQSIIDELASFGEKKNLIQKALRAYIDSIQKRADKEKEAILDILQILESDAFSSKGLKKTSEMERKRFTDEQIIEKIRFILQGGKKMSQKALHESIGIQYNRWKKFLNKNSDLFGFEGKKKTSVIFLK